MNTSVCGELSRCEDSSQMRILNAETEPVNVVEDFLFEGITPESGVLNSL